jgi:hypothetical protein
MTCTNIANSLHFDLVSIKAILVKIDYKEERQDTFKMRELAQAVRRVKTAIQLHLDTYV